jgi:hypothetical protein
MPIVFSAKLDGSEAVRHYHISLVAFYLREARRHALACASMPKGEESHFSEGLLAILLSALCLEAFSNEMAESVIAEHELPDFFKMRRRFRKPSAYRSSVTWKTACLFEAKWAHALDTDTLLVSRIESLFELRNALVHYNLTASAGRMHLPAPAQIPVEGGGMMTVIDFEQTATRVEKPLISTVDAKSAKQSYNTSLAVIRLWNRLANAPAGALSAHQELTD